MIRFAVVCGLLFFACQKYGVGPDVDKWQRKIYKCPTPGTDKVGKCPTVPGEWGAGRSWN